MKRAARWLLLVVAILSTSVAEAYPIEPNSPNGDTTVRVPAFASDSPIPSGSTPPLDDAESPDLAGAVAASEETETPEPIAAASENKAGEDVAVLQSEVAEWNGVVRESPNAALEMESLAALPARPRITSMNGGFLLLNMHGALFHSEPWDLQENISYARWMGAGVIRVFATDSNSFKQWDGVMVGNRIADAAPVFRHWNVKLIVALVNNHRPVPGEIPESFGFMDGYDQLLLPFYTHNWRDAYLRFASDLITTVRSRGAQDVIFAWELGNELHTPQDPAALKPFVVDAVQEIKKLDPTTPILPGTMGVNHLEAWNVRSEIARWLYCEAPVDAYTLHAYDWVSRDRQGDMPISWDLDYTTAEPCRSGRKLPVIVEELGTSRFLGNVYNEEQEQKRLEQELRQLRFVLGFPQVIGVGAWSGESPRVSDKVFYDDNRGLNSYGAGARGGGSAYDPRPEATPGARARMEEILRNLPALP